MARGMQWKAYSEERGERREKRTRISLEKGGKAREKKSNRVPNRKKGVLPLIRHRENVLNVHVLPLLVANVLALGRRGRLSWVSLDPLLLNEHVELLRPASTEKGRVSRGSGKEEGGRGREGDTKRTRACPTTPAS
jgi:hypothetical protein